MSQADMLTGLRFACPCGASMIARQGERGLPGIWSCPACGIVIRPSLASILAAVKDGKIRLAVALWLMSISAGT